MFRVWRGWHRPTLHCSCRHGYQHNSTRQYGGQSTHLLVLSPSLSSLYLPCPVCTLDSVSPSSLCSHYNLLFLCQSVSGSAITAWLNLCFLLAIQFLIQLLSLLVLPPPLPRPQPPPPLPVYVDLKVNGFFSCCFFLHKRFKAYSGTPYSCLVLRLAA